MNLTLLHCRVLTPAAIPVNPDKVRSLLLLREDETLDKFAYLGHHRAQRHINWTRTFARTGLEYVDYRLTKHEDELGTTRYDFARHPQCDKSVKPMVSFWHDWSHSADLPPEDKPILQGDVITCLNSPLMLRHELLTRLYCVVSPSIKKMFKPGVDQYVGEYEDLCALRAQCDASHPQHHLLEQNLLKFWNEDLDFLVIQWPDNKMPAHPYITECLLT